MLRVIAASCASDPLVACKVICESPAGVLEAEVTVNVWDELALTVSGDAGLADVPAGRPDIAIETEPLNPCDPRMETVTGTLVLPCTKLTDVGENTEVTDTEKSGAGGGGGGFIDIPPPQPVSRDIHNDEMTEVNPRWYVNAACSLVVNALMGLREERSAALRHVVRILSP